MNNYSSRLDTCVAMDAYNLPWPVLPPAALDIAGTSFSARYLALRGSGSKTGRKSDVIGFNRRDKLFIRSVSMECNFADGLVDNATVHSYFSGPTIKTNLDRLMPAGTGTIANNPGATPTAIVGSGTLFTQEYAPNQTCVFFDDGGNLQVITITSVTDDTHLVVAGISNLGMYAGITTVAGILYALVIDDADSNTLMLPGLSTTCAVSFFQGLYDGIRPTRGTVTIPAGVAGGPNIVMQGFGTVFTRDLVVGQYLRYVSNASTVCCVVVASITDDTHAVLTVPASGVAGVPTALTNGALGIPAVATADDPELKSLSGWQEAFIAIRVTPASTGNHIKYSTINIDPAYQVAGVQLAFNYVVEVEHTFATSNPGVLA